MSSNGKNLRSKLNAKKANSGKNDTVKKPTPKTPTFKFNTKSQNSPPEKATIKAKGNTPPKKNYST